MSIEPFVNKVFHGDALALMRAMPTASIDAVIADAMYGTSKNCLLRLGFGPSQGRPGKALGLSPADLRGVSPSSPARRRLGLAQDIKFMRTLSTWFGPHRIWTRPICPKRRPSSFNPTPGSCRRRIGGRFVSLTGTAWIA